MSSGSSVKPDHLLVQLASQQDGKADTTTRTASSSRGRRHPQNDPARSFPLPRPHPVKTIVPSAPRRAPSSSPRSQRGDSGWMSCPPEPSTMLSRLPTARTAVSGRSIEPSRWPSSHQPWSRRRSMDGYLAVLGSPACAICRLNGPTSTRCSGYPGKVPAAQDRPRQDQDFFGQRPSPKFGTHRPPETKRGKWCATKPRKRRHFS